MIVRLFALVLALAGSLLLHSPAAAQAAQDEAAAGELLAIPFDPPLDEALYYHVSITREQGGEIVRNYLARQSLRFSRSGAGFGLTVTYIGVQTEDGYLDLASESARSRIAPAELALMRPVSFDLDESGSLLRVREWDAWRQSVQSFIAALVETMPEAERPRMRQIMGNAMQPFLALDEEAAANVILKGWPSFFGFGGVALEEGAEYESETEEPAAMLPVAIPFVHRISLYRTESGDDLLFFQESEPDQGRTATAITDYVRKIAGTLPDAQRAEMDKVLDQFRTMQIRDSLEAQFDGKSGLLVEGSYERHISVSIDGAQQEVVDTTRIRRVP